MDLAEVYRRHFKFVWRCLKRLGVADEQIDDAVQEVFLVVHHKLADFDGESEVTTWLYAIALRIARRSHRAHFKERSRKVEDSAETLELTAGTLGRAPEDSERLALAQRILMKMDQAKREVFVLAVIEGLSAPEIAPILGVPINTVYSRVRAARSAFAEHLREMNDGTVDSSRTPRSR